MEKIAELHSISPDSALALSRHMDSSIRRMGRDAAAGPLLAAIALTAQAYGARHEIVPTVAKECAELVLSKFAHLAIDEIAEAYCQWASGQIEVKGGEMYGGSFNAAQFGKVLSAYSERRRAIAAAISNAAAQERIEAEQARRKADMERRFAEEFPRTFEKVRAEATGWEGVPGYFFQVLWQRGLITFTVGEGQDIRQRAEAIAMAQLEKEKQEANRFGRLSTLEDRRRIIGGKMLVWEKAITNPDFQLKNF